jgi:hypothetical protein
MGFMGLMADIEDDLAIDVHNSNCRFQDRGKRAGLQKRHAAVA